MDSRREGVGGLADTVTEGQGDALTGRHGDAATRGRGDKQSGNLARSKAGKSQRRQNIFVKPPDEPPSGRGGRTGACPGPKAGMVSRVCWSGTPVLL